MKTKLEEILRAHGQEITLVRREDGGETPVLAFLQPLLKERTEPPVTVTPLGAVSDQRWLYIGPAAQGFEPGDEVRFNGECFVAQEAMTICFRREALYFRAVLRRKKEAAG